jgi:hypothetical protein
MSGSAPGLGLRSGSYGSLPAAVGGSGRKAAGRGWALRGEKERLQLLHRALRLVGRRRAGLLLLLAVASAAVFCSLFAVVKGPPIPPLLLPARLLLGSLALGFGRRVGSFVGSGSRCWRLRNLN